MPTSSRPFPALFVPHGAPTMALEPGRAGAALRRFAATLPRPRAVVVVSAHWQAERPTVGCAEVPETLHDFHGFPPELYGLRYAARGDRALAATTLSALKDAGLQPASDPNRGLDHGAWTPLMLMYPEGDIPVVPLSLLGAQGPREHLALGRALRGLLDQGVLILASGNLTHNLSDFQLGAASGGEPLGRVHSNRRDCVCRDGMGAKARGAGNGRSIPKPSNAGDRPPRQTRRARVWRGALPRCRSLVQITAPRDRRLALPPRQTLAQPVAYCEHALAYVDEFAAWIHERLDRSDDAALVDYRQQAPAAQRAHPSEEHLLPLFVALGAGGPHCRRERFHAGIDYGVLAMDAYAFRPASHS